MPLRVWRWRRGPAGCGNSRSILYKGIGVGAGVSGPRIVISDARAVRDGKAIRKQWLAEIARAGRKYPKQRFDNVPESRFRARLAEAAARDQFTVKRVEFLHPRQAAPLVIVQSRHYLDMAHLYGRVLFKLIDPIRTPPTQGSIRSGLLRSAGRAGRAIHHCERREQRAEPPRRRVGTKRGALPRPPRIDARLGQCSGMTAERLGRSNRGERPALAQSRHSHLTRDRGGNSHASSAGCVSAAIR